mgnify:CR=1 FL=1
MAHKTTVPAEKQQPSNEPVEQATPYDPAHRKSIYEPMEHNGDIEDQNLELAHFGHTDVANARRLLSRYGRDIAYVSGIGFLVWDGMRWCPDRSDLAVRPLAHRVADEIQFEARALRAAAADREVVDALFKWRRTSENSARVEAMIREARPYVQKSIESLDSNTFLVNASNGVTIRLGEPPEHFEPGLDLPFVTPGSPDRDDLLTRQLGVAFEQDATCPNWEKFLSEILPDTELRAFLQRWCGYLLTGSVEEQVLVICHGLGANGKSTLLETLSFVLGDYAVGLSFASLLRDERKRGSDASPDISRLRGTRLAVASEPDTGARFSESTIKQLTGGDRITAREIYHSFVEFQPTFKLMLSVNNRPQIRGQDEGIWRRLLMLPFERIIPPEQRDRRLPEKLKSEGSGILNWMIGGYCDWRVNGLNVPDRVRHATEDYREHEDPVGSFLSSRTRPEPNKNIRATELYGEYSQWCHENGESTYNQKAFGRIMSERGIERVKKGVYFYRGIELIKTPPDTDDSPSDGEI